jgi:hypothetical protein
VLPDNWAVAALLRSQKPLRFSAYVLSVQPPRLFIGGWTASSYFCRILIDHQLLQRRWSSRLKTIQTQWTVVMFPYWIDSQLASLPEILVMLTGALAVVFSLFSGGRSGI